jgi:hypothetical protein
MTRLAVALLGLSGVLCAQRPVPTVTQKRLDAMVLHWRHVLRLDDWTVTVTALAIDELPEATAGVSRVIPEAQTLQIGVMRPADYGEMAARMGIAAKTGRAIVRDIENSVLHELLHLRLSAFRRAGPREMGAAEELVVDRLTTALLAARDGK